MSKFYASGALDRHDLAELVARHVAAASDPSDPAAGGVAAASAAWLRDWAERSNAVSGSIEDWAHPASALTCEEFLSPGELAALVDYVLSREADFSAGTLVSGDSPEAYIDRSFRAAETLFDLGPFKDLFARRVERYLPFVCERLGFPSLDQHWFECQLAAIPDGGFFCQHEDNTHPDTATRRLTCVFYFYCSPEIPAGGELRFSPTGAWRGPREFRPLANRMIFFDSSTPHEVLPVRAQSDGFEAARFTVNGWVHQARG